VKQLSLGFCLKELLFIGVVAYCGLIAGTTKAQVIPDRTLGSENSVVVPNLDIKGIDSDRIEGGAIRGSNLFHSFQEFNINEGRGVYFANPAAIVNIFTRITGLKPSAISGTLGVLGNANLFLLNPNGIIFGPNARLDLKGSFLATTAKSFKFPDGSEFGTRNPGAPPLLTVQVRQPIGLRFEGQEGIITNAADLTVAPQQTLSLSGSRVTMTGKITAPGGSVELLGTESVALLENARIDVSAADGGGTVSIGRDLGGTVPNTKRTYIGSNVRIDADALVNGNGGKVVIWADEVTGFYGRISARGGLELGHGGMVEVSGKEHLIFRGNVNTSAVNGLPGTLLLDPTDIIIADGSGDGTEDDTALTTIYESELERLSGDTNIILQATNNITLQNLSDDRLDLAAGGGAIAFSADADGDGIGAFVMDDIADTIFTNGRNITISGANLAIGNINTTAPAVDSGTIDLTATGNINIQGTVDSSVNQGEGGAINITASSVLLTDGSRINASLRGVGNAGAIAITAMDTITLEGENSRGTGSAIVSQVLPEAEGTSGGITIKTGSLSLKNGAFLSASTFGLGNAGAIAITATEDIILSGESSQAIPSAIVSRVIGDAAGNSGEIIIQTTSLTLQNGALIDASTFAQGDAGAITITARDAFTITGEDSQGFVTAIFSRVEETAEGNSGGINIKTSSLTIQDGAVINASTFGKGDAGAIIITATGDITLKGKDSIGLGSQIFSQVTETAEGDSEGVNIQTSSLTLEDGGTISGTTKGKGNSGAISIIATGDITLKGRDNPQELGSEILSRVTETAEGNSEGINIQTSSLTLEDGARINASTLGSGNAGAINITATDTISLAGTDVGLFAQTQGAGKAGNITIYSSQVTLDRGASISATTSAGVGGSIDLSGNHLNLSQGSQIRTTTSGDNNAGDITLRLENRIDASGSSTGIFADTTDNAIGNGGNLFIDSTILNLADGATISVDNLGQGIGGNIEIHAADLTLTNGKITGQTAGNTGGNITLNLDNILSLRNGSQISTTAGTAQAGGDGGNITIDSRFILAIPAENSDITANAFLGNGGNIFITAEGIVGIAFREQPTPLSDITASSEFGLAGVVAINSPDTEPNQRLVTLPQQAVDTKIVLGCNIEQQSAAAFYNLGRGGTPDSPDAFLSPDLAIEEWIPLTEQFNLPEDSQSPIHRIITRFIPSCE
jgi:filamentous hemagglutinin family protein